MRLTSRYDIPLEENPGNACALCCYTMVSHYFFPEKYTFEDIGKIADWRKGYVVWEFPFMEWFLEKGGTVAFWDDIDYRMWSDKGFNALKSSMPEAECAYFEKNTYDLDALRDVIGKVLRNNNVQYNYRKPCFNDLQSNIADGKVCCVVLNNNALEKRDGLELHQVLVLDITDEHVIFHNPLGQGKAQAAQKETIEHFRYAWLEATASPGLCVYEMKED